MDDVTDLDGTDDTMDDFDEDLPHPAHVVSVSKHQPHRMNQNRKRESSPTFAQIHCNKRNSRQQRLRDQRRTAAPEFRWQKAMASVGTSGAGSYYYYKTATSKTTWSRPADHTSDDGSGRRADGTRGRVRLVKIRVGIRVGMVTSRPRPTRLGVGLLPVRGTVTGNYRK